MRIVGGTFPRLNNRLVHFGGKFAMMFMALLLVSGCVASQKGSSKNDLASALSPNEASDGTKATASKKVESTDADGDTKSALSKESSKITPAQSAVETASAKSSDTKTKSAKTTSSPKPDPSKDAPKTLFAALSSSNEKSSSKRPKDAPPVKRTVVRKKGAPSSLPGVRKKSTIFGILSDDNPNEDLDEPVEVVSLPSQTRRGNFGLLLQTKSVKVHCFPRRLVRILKRVERRYGRKVMVTSGYRSRAKNRRVRGAKNSIHISCAAADIQVRGVSKWKLARYLRSVPGRGGVGTYCHTNSVHIDVGKKRDWNWRCRRKKRRRR